MARDFKHEIAAAVKSDDVAALAALAYQLLGRVEAEDERRAFQANKKRNQRAKVVSGTSGMSPNVPGRPGTSGDVPDTVHYYKDLKDTTTPRAQSVREILSVDDVKLIATVDAIERESGEHWPDIDAFLVRREYAKWQGWLDEMRKACGPGSQYTWADVGRVCSDDVLLKKPLGSAYALRRFLPNARMERVNVGADHPPSGAGAGPRPGTGARAFATTLAAIEDL